MSRLRVHRWKDIDPTGLSREDRWKRQVLLKANLVKTGNALRELRSRMRKKEAAIEKAVRETRELEKKHDDLTRYQGLVIWMITKIRESNAEEC